MAKPGNRYQQNNKRTILLLIILISTFVTGFSIGLHLHGTFSSWIYEGKMSATKFSCFGHTNWWETYQLDCYFPKQKPVSSFKMSPHLKCHWLQTTSLGEDTYSASTRKYVSTRTFKTDNINFDINIDTTNNILTRSSSDGEVAKGPFDIIVNDEKVLIALRKSDLGEIFKSFAYEEILLLKNSGKGVITLSHSPWDGDSEDVTTTQIICH